MSKTKILLQLLFFSLFACTFVFSIQDLPADKIAVAVISVIMILETFDMKEANK